MDKQFNEHVEKTKTGFERTKEDILMIHRRLDNQTEAIEDLIKLLRDDILTKKQLEKVVNEDSVDDILTRIFLKA